MRRLDCSVSFKQHRNTGKQNKVWAQGGFDSTSTFITDIFRSLQYVYICVCWCIWMSIWLYEDAVSETIKLLVFPINKKVRAQHAFRKPAEKHEKFQLCYRSITPQLRGVLSYHQTSRGERSPWLEHMHHYHHQPQGNRCIRCITQKKKKNYKPSTCRCCRSMVYSSIFGGWLNNHCDWSGQVMDIHMSFIVHFDWMESSEGKAAIKKSLKKACKKR